MLKKKKKHTPREKMMCNQNKLFLICKAFTATCVLYVFFCVVITDIVHQVGCKLILTPLQRRSLINVTGKFRHMPQALVSINTSPGENYLDWQAAALLKTFNCEKRGAKWKEVRKMSLELPLSCAFALHRCAAEPVQLAHWQMGKNSPIWAGR